MNNFRFLLKLQSLWLAAGILFHIISFAWVSLGFGSLSVNSPLSSIIGMSLFIPVILLGWRSKYLLYGIMNGILISLIFYKGYLFQVLAIFQPEGLAIFPSIPAWFAGIAINTFGVPLGIYTTYRALKRTFAGH